MKEFENVDLFNLSVNDESQNVFDERPTNNDGIFRPSLKDAKDKKVGYRAVIRFLPNFLESGKIGEAAVVKHLHYVNFKNEPKLSGFYDCAKNHDPKKPCELCTMYWALFNSKNQLEVEKASLIKKSTKYYSYILVLEDEQHPEWVGKIMIYPYGFTIKQKIKSEKDGEVSGESCNVFDLTRGKDFTLLIKAKGENPDYSMSQFGQRSALKLYSEKNKSFVEIPYNHTTFEIEKPEVKEKIKKTLLSRTVDLADHMPLEWDDETKNKVNDILSILSGNDISKAEKISRNTSTDSSKPKKTDATVATVVDIEDDTDSEVTSNEDFFNIDD
jgi:hypothetical protein